MAKVDTKRMEFHTYPDWVHQELMNWSRWCWQGPYPHPMEPDTCASFEKNYRRRSEEEEKQEVRRALPIRERAERVQAVWDTLAHWPKQVMRSEYPQRFGNVQDRARALGISIGQYESALSAAAYKVMIEFEGDL